MDFNDYAKNWDSDRRIERARVISEEIISSIDIDDGYNAMEFGCGTGLVSFNMYDQFKTITLIDSSKGMIDVVNKKINQYNLENITPYHIDLTNSNIKQKFDVIYNSMVLHHIDDIKAIIQKFHQLLNENGELCIVDLDEEDGSFHKKYPDFNGHNGFNHKALTSILKESGFKDIKIRTFYNGEKVFEGEIINYSLFILTARK